MILDWTQNPDKAKKTSMVIYLVMVIICKIVEEGKLDGTYIPLHTNNNKEVAYRVFLYYFALHTGDYVVGNRRR